MPADVAIPAGLNGPPPAAPATLPESGYRREYLSGGAPHEYPLLLGGETAFDRAVARHGLVRVVDQMLADAKVGSTFDSIKMSVLADGIQVTANILPKFGANPGDADLDTEGETDGDAEHAFEVGQFVARCLSRLIAPNPIETSFWQLMDARFYRCKLAEKVFAIDPDGIDAGKMVLARLKVKSQLAWAFAVDDLGNVLGIWGGDASVDEEGQKTLRLLPRDKFVIFTHDPRDDDPRGRSIGPRVYDPFYDKFQARERYKKYLGKFAAPVIVGMVGPNEQSRPTPDPETGKLTPTDRTPVQAMATMLSAHENCSYYAVANGAKIEVIFPTGNGEAFQAALAYYDKQIVSAMLHSPRATEEAQFGSRADSESAQDEKGILIRYFKRTLAQLIRDDIAYDLVRLNYGKDWADRYTPNVSLGLIEHQDFSRNSGAVAKLWQAGFLDESQRPGLCTFLGLPMPKPRPDAQENPAAQPGGGPGKNPAKPAPKGAPAAPPG